MLQIDDEVPKTTLRCRRKKEGGEGHCEQKMWKEK